MRVRSAMLELCRDAPCRATAAWFTRIRNTDRSIGSGRYSKAELAGDPAHGLAVDGHRNEHPALVVGLGQRRWIHPQSLQPPTDMFRQLARLVDQATLRIDGQEPRPGTRQRMIGDRKEQPVRLQVLSRRVQHSGE